MTLSLPRFAFFDGAERVICSSRAMESSLSSLNRRRQGHLRNDVTRLRVKQPVP